MNDSTPSQIRSAVRIIVRILIAIVIVVVVLGVTLWRAPLWVASTLTELRLSREGIHGHSMAIGGYNVHYIEGGTGQPIVLIHGLGSQAQQDWNALAPYLVRAGYHVYAMDLLGFGRSSKPADATYSIPEQVKFVEAFLDAKHLDSVVLGGVSMGGWIASAVALEHPQRVSRLMLFDSAGISFKLSFDSAVFTPQTDDQVDELMALVTPDPPPLPGFLKEDFVRRAKRDGWVVRRALASMLAGSDFLDTKFSALKMPMLIVWGKQDRMTPLSLGESMHLAAPQSVLAVYDGCGHVAVVTCEDRLAPAVLGFLAGTGSQPGQTIEDPARKL